MINVALANATGTINVMDVLNRVVNWTFTFLLAFAVISILYSAFLFLTAGGDPEKINKAKSQLMYSVVAIAIALVAKGVVFIVKDILGIPNTP